MFGSRLKERRELAGLSQTRFSSAVNGVADTGYDDTSVRRWERGEGWPSAKALPAIAQVLGVSLDYLFGISDDPRGAGIKWTTS